MSQDKDSQHPLGEGWQELGTSADGSMRLHIGPPGAPLPFVPDVLKEINVGHLLDRGPIMYGPDYQPIRSGDAPRPFIPDGLPHRDISISEPEVGKIGRFVSHSALTPIRGPLSEWQDMGITDTGDWDGKISRPEAEEAPEGVQGESPTHDQDSGKL